MKIVAEVEQQTLMECPPGLFLFEGELCVKTEYYINVNGDKDQPQAYVVRTGEFFQGGCEGDNSKRKNLLVRPCTAIKESGY